MKSKTQRILAALAALTVLTASACGKRNSQEDLPTDTSENAGTPAVTTDAVSETISKSEAIEIASKHWGIRTGDVDPDNGFLYRIDSQGTVQAPDGRVVYNIFLRWLVESPGGSHYSTVENIWVDAVTGAVREAEIAK